MEVPTMVEQFDLTIRLYENGHAYVELGVGPAPTVYEVWLTHGCRTPRGLFDAVEWVQWKLAWYAEMGALGLSG